MISTLAFVGLLLAGCADDVSPAVRVGDTKISYSEMQDEIDEWIGNAALVDGGIADAVPPGAYEGDFVRGLVAQRVSLELNNQKFEEQGLVLDDAMRQEAVTVVFGDQATADKQLGGFSDAYAAAILDDLARQIGLSNALGEEGYTEWRAEANASSEIEVSPRYGTWDPATATVLAPAEPLPAPPGT